MRDGGRRTPGGCRDEGSGDGSVDKAGRADAWQRLPAKDSEQVGWLTTL